MEYLSPTLMKCRKGEKFKLSKDFNSSEFEDGISDFVLIDKRLVDRLQKLRDHLICSITITSGYRSAAKQEQLKQQGYETASGVSTHEVGCAVDLTTGKHTGEQLERAARFVGFKAVGRGSTWIHVDIRDDKDRSWGYTARKG